MKNKKNIFIFVPVIVPVNFFKKLFTTPKIHIPTVSNDGKENPIIIKGKYWYVYYWYRNPKTNKLEKFIEKKGINRIDNLVLRQKAIKNLQKAIHRYLQEGFNPFETITLNDKVENNSYSIKDAFVEAYNEKAKVWSKTTQDIHYNQFKIFKKWLKEQIFDECINPSSKAGSRWLHFQTQSRKFTTDAETAARDRAEESYYDGEGRD